MILQALIAYAEREKLGENPNFESVGIHWLVPLDSNGKLAGGLILQFEEANSNVKKPRPKRVVRPKSDPDFVGHGRSYFLCDTLERCLLYAEDEVKRSSRKVNHAYFVQLLDEAAKECKYERTRLNLLAAFLRNNEQLENLHALLNSAKAEPSSKAAFSVDGVELLKSPELQSWWQKRCERERAEVGADEAVCLATGRFGAICRTTGFIKGLTEAERNNNLSNYLLGLIP